MKSIVCSTSIHIGLASHIAYTPDKEFVIGKYIYLYRCKFVNNKLILNCLTFTTVV